MLRIFSYAVIVLAAAWGFSWLADRPGQVMVLWQGQRIEMSLMVATSFVAVAVVVLLLLWWLIRLLWTSPQSVTRYFRARKRDRGYQALSTGLIAAGAGNALLAGKMAERTRSLISADQEPLIHLLEAQTALITGNHEAARQTFEAMAEDPETRELGLRGLFMEARRLGADEAAEHYASQAVAKAPYLPWASQAMLEYRTRAGDFDGALDILAKQRASGTAGGRDTSRERAVLLTARAGSRLDADPKAAREDALQALKLSPALVPAAVIAARAYYREDNLKRGNAVIEQVWKLEPHPDLAETYIRARGGDSALDRLKRAEKLESLNPGNPIGLAATAQAALDARRFDLAREKAEAALKRDPREGLLLLLADIEQEETGDQARIRHYINAALKAPRDPAWVADGVVSQVWQAVSPVTGEIGVFEWKPPFDQSEEAKTILAELEKAPPPRSVEPERMIDHLEPSAARAPEPVAPVAPAEPAAVGAPSGASVPSPSTSRAGDQPAVVPFFGHPPDDPGVRKGAAAPSPEKKRKPLF